MPPKSRSANRPDEGPQVPLVPSTPGRGGRTSKNAESVNPNVEIELKLLCSPDQLDKIIKSPDIARYGHGEGKEINLRAIYYDTPEFDLHDSGAVLRVRSDGTRFVMTMKSRKGGEGKAIERTEQKVPVESMEPDANALSQFVTAENFAQIEDKPLVPHFSVEVQRRTRLLQTPHGTIELAVDQGHVFAGERSEEISEIELELMSGSPEALFQMAQELGSSFHLRPSIRSKSARGFDLIMGIPPQVAKTRPIAFDPAATLSDALDCVLRSVVQHLLANQPAAENGGNPAGLHQYRVALRRLRSMLGVIRQVAPSTHLDAFGQDAKWLMSNLSDARDWDVFVTQTLPTVAQSCPAVDGFGALVQIAEKQREKAHAKARAAINDPRIGRFQVALGLWVERRGWLQDASPDRVAQLEGPAHIFAAQILDKLRRKAVKRGRLIEKLEPEERHELRIAIKKLRYAADFFLPLFGKPKRNRQYVKTLARLQDHLGRQNDLVVTERLVQIIMKDRPPVAIHQAAGALLGWQAGHLNQDNGDLNTIWKVLQSREPTVVASTESKGG